MGVILKITILKTDLFSELLETDLFILCVSCVLRLLYYMVRGLSIVLNYLCVRL